MDSQNPQGRPVAVLEFRPDSFSELVFNDGHSPVFRTDAVKAARSPLWLADDPASVKHWRLTLSSLSALVSLYNCYDQRL